MLAVQRLTISVVLTLSLLGGLKRVLCGVTAVTGPLISLMSLKRPTARSVPLDASAGDGVDLMPGRLMLGLVGAVFLLLVGCLSVTITESLRSVVCLDGFIW
ncbi:hypothetical protein BSN81_16775, partial [Acinetobacter baylyi]